MAVGLELLCSLGPKLSSAGPTCLPALLYLQHVIVNLAHVWDSDAQGF